MNLNVDFFKINYQLRIDKYNQIFFEILEIFLDAVFLLTTPSLATCVRID